MRKKSHIALTTYLLNQMKDSGMQKHKFSFYLGSILPDIKPSFIYKRHEYSGTIEDTKRKVEELLKMNITKKRHGRKYYRGLGEVSHNENGINRTWANADDSDILRRVTPMARVM